MQKPLCTCGMAMSMAIVVGHLCPVHHRESFVNGQHPLHEHFATTPPRAAFVWVASGQQQAFDPNDDDLLTGYYSTHGD